MSYAGSPEFEAMKARHQAISARMRAETEARLDILSAESRPPQEITTPERLAARLLSGRLPQG